MSEKKVGKRLLTWVLVLVMTLSLLPLNVLAEEFDDSMQLEPTTEEDMIETDEETFDEAEPAALSARKKNYTEEAQFYYLKSPTSDPYSNGPNDWGKCLGNGEIDTKNLKFVWDWDSFQYKNAYNVEGCVTKWPDGVDQDGVLTKDLTSGSHWMTIFNAFQKDCEDKNGITGLTPNDVESITLKPFKVSRYNNGSTPDKHVDCKVEIKCTRVVTATFYFVDSEDKNVQLLSKNYKINGYIPEYDIADAEREANKLVPEDYELIKWYTDSAFTTEANPKAELTGNVDFYCKAEPVKTYTVTYDANGGTGTVPKDDGEYRLNEEVTVKGGDDLKKDGYEFTGWNTKEDGTGDAYAISDTFEITKDTTLYAQWEAKEYSYTVKYYKDSELLDTVTSDVTYELGAQISKDVIEDKCPAGYALDTGKSTQMPYTITDGDNIIEVYYTKRSDLSYTVNYYWNGTTQTVADSKTVENQAFGTEVTESPIAIEGYTPVSSAKKTITIGTDSNVITFYYYKNVKLTANSSEVTYDGNEHTVTGYTAKDNENKSVEGLTFNDFASPSVSGTNADTYDVTFSGAENKVSEDGLYIVTDTVNGKLTITKRSVTLTSADAEKVYDGDPLTNHEVTVTSGSFVTGEGATYDVTGTITDVGTEKNTFTYTLNNGTKAENYEITTKYGKLEVTPNETEVTVTITGKTDSKTYNGSEQSITGYTVESISDSRYTANDFTFSGTALAKGTDAGTYPMGLKPENFENKNANFSKVTFVVTDGSLTITKRDVTLTSANASKPYDGTALTKPDVKVTSGSFVDGEVTDIKATGTITDFGEVTNTITYNEGANFKADNYEITTTEGKLTITKRPVTLTSASDSKVYDGTALTNGTVNVGGKGFAKDEGATYNVTGSQTEVGKSDNEFTYELNANTKASNYNITMHKGQLVITAADSVTYKVEHYKQNLDGSYNNTPDDIDPLSGTAGTLTAAAAKDYPGFTHGTVTQEKIKSDGTTIIKIRYTRNSYTLTINYVYRDGSKAAESHIETILYGKDYSVTSPKISGYTADKLVVSGTMPADNRTVTVTYTKNGGHHPRPKPTVEIEDDDALGLNTTDHFAYIVGYGNGEVRPQNNITRAEVATIFFRLLTDDVRDENLTKTNRYSDVTRADWYNTAVSTLSSMGIITGYPDGTFRPNAAITRAEFAAIAARFDHDGDKTAAKFSDIASHWAKDEISIAYNNGWITGYPDGTFGPQRDITRAETMTLVNRVLNRQPETEDDLLPNMTVWTDNANPNAWYYLAVQEATNSHYYKFKTNSKYEKWTELRETRDWTLLEK